MRFRLELFVAELDASIGFYEQVLGFALERRERGYASLRRGDAVLGLGRIEDLPPAGPGPGFTQERLRGLRGAGTEIVLEVEDVEAACGQAGAHVAEPLTERPWGLRDFRLADPDGYYWRVTSV